LWWYNYNIFWEEIANPSNSGTLAGLVWTTTVTFPSAWTYRVHITWTFPRIQFSNTWDRLKILSIEQRWTGSWLGMQDAFFGASNMVLNAVDAPILSWGNLSQMFRNASLVNGPMNHWNTSSVTTMEAMFRWATSFNQPLNNWNVSRVTNFWSMFFSATAFNQPLSGWNTTSGTTMTAMFRSATAFNQDISSWDVSRVADFSQMFYTARAFNQPLSWWNTSNWTNTSQMFREASAFNQDISSWDMGKVTNANAMFYDATWFNQPLNSWNVSRVSDFWNMFYGASLFNQPLSGWNTISWTNMNGLFRFTSFNQDISTWNTSNVTNMWTLFYANPVFNQPINSRDVSKVTIMLNMFWWASSFNQPLNNWNVSNVGNMGAMFYGASNFNQDISSWDVSKVTNMDSMFRSAVAFEQNIGVWNVTGVTNMTDLFRFVTLNTSTYDAILTWFASRPTLKTWVVFNGGNSRYCLWSWARAQLISMYSWTITDLWFGGCPPPTITITTWLKISNTWITDTTILVNAGQWILSTWVTIHGSSTVWTTWFSCIQLNANNVSCGLTILTGGNLVISATDVSWANSLLAENNYIIDITVPTISLQVNTLSPFTKDAPNIIFTWSDNNWINYCTLSYYEDDLAWWTTWGAWQTIDPATSPVSLNLDPDRLTHEVSVTCFDIAWNTGTQSTLFPSVITFSTPTLISSGTIGDAQVTVLSPNGTNLDTLTITWSAWSPALWVCAIAALIPWEYYSPVTCSLLGITESMTVTVQARDVSNASFGNNSTSFVIDNIAPVVSVTPITLLSSSPIVDMSISVNDNMAVSSWAIVIDPISTVWYTWFVCSQITSSVVSCSIQILSWWDIVVGAYDSVGNYASGLATWFIIDTLPPTVTIVDDFSLTPTTSDTILVNVSDLRWIQTWSLLYAFTSSTCDNTVSFTEIYTWWVSFQASDSLYNGQYICFQATDSLWNTSYTRTVNTFSFLFPLNLFPPVVTYTWVYATWWITFTWTAQTWTTVEIRDSANDLLCSNVVNGSGGFSCGPLSPVLADGTHTLSGYAINGSGVYSSWYGFSVEVDTQAPVITLIWGSSINLTVWDTYVESWATANDVRDGDVTSNIVISWSVNIALSGVYQKFYQVADAVWNIWYATRTIIVSPVVAPPAPPPAAPVVTYTWVYATWWITFTWTAQTWTTVEIRSSTNTLLCSGSVNGSGEFSCGPLSPVLWDWVRNLSGYAISGSWVYSSWYGFSVVVDTTWPVITLIWGSSINLTVWDTYNDPWATANDARDGNVSANIQTTWSVNTALTWVYQIIYQVADSLWNSTQAIRTITVSPEVVLPPVLTGQTSTWFWWGGWWTLTSDWLANLIESTKNEWTINNPTNQPDSNQSTNWWSMPVEPLRDVATISTREYRGWWSTTVQSPTKVEFSFVPSIYVDSSKCYAANTSHVLSDSNGFSDQQKFAISFMMWYDMTSLEDVSWFDRQVTREQFAKYIVQFAKNVLCRNQRLSSTPSYADIWSADSTLTSYIIEAYKYWLMKWDWSSGQWTFRPKALISSKEIMTIMVRLLVDAKLDEDGDVWYENYQSAANEMWISKYFSSWGSALLYRKNIAVMFYDMYRIVPYSYVAQWWDSFYVHRDYMKIQKEYVDGTQ
jgi:surface protein